MRIAKCQRVVVHHRDAHILAVLGARFGILFRDNIWNFAREIQHTSWPTKDLIFVQYVSFWSELPGETAGMVNIGSKHDYWHAVSCQVCSQ